MIRACLSRAAALLAALALAAGLWACDGGASECSAPEIQPHLSPVNFGDLQVRPAGGGDPATNVAVPFEWVLLLQSKCAEPLKITEVCLVGDHHNGVEGDGAFTVEGPVPPTVPFRSEAAVRLTYDHPDPNTVDADEDGEADPDSVALVVQSNAVNFPTLIVPICARIIPEGQEREAIVCESPVVVPAGQQDLSLCGAAPSTPEGGADARP